MKPETIKGISPDNNLPTNLSRKGVTDFGNTFGDNPNLTNAKIAIPYLDNPQAVHFANLSAEEKKRYFELIDALNNKDKSLFCSYFKDKKIAELTYDNAKKELEKFYDDVKKYMEVKDLTINIQGVVNENKLELYYISLSNGKKSNLINFKYGLSGVIAPWNSSEAVLIGGGNQFSLPFTMDTLKKLQIIDRIY